MIFKGPFNPNRSMILFSGIFQKTAPEGKREQVLSVAAHGCP